MGALVDFEAHDHAVLLKVILTRHLHLLESSEQRLRCPITCLQEASALLQGRGGGDTAGCPLPAFSHIFTLCYHSILILQAVFRVGEEYTS